MQERAVRYLNVTVGHLAPTSDEAVIEGGSGIGAGRHSDVFFASRTFLDVFGEKLS